MQLGDYGDTVTEPTYQASWTSGWIQLSPAGVSSLRRIIRQVGGLAESGTWWVFIYTDHLDTPSLTIPPGGAALYWVVPLTTALMPGTPASYVPNAMRVGQRAQCVKITVISTTSQDEGEELKRLELMIE